MNFKNNDLLRFLEATYDNWQRRTITNEVNESLRLNEAHETATPIHTSNTFEFSLVQKKNIEWINKPWHASKLKLYNLVRSTFQLVCRRQLIIL